MIRTYAKKFALRQAQGERSVKRQHHHPFYGEPVEPRCVSANDFCCACGVHFCAGVRIARIGNSCKGSKGKDGASRKKSVFLAGAQNRLSFLASEVFFLSARSFSFTIFVIADRFVMLSVNQPFFNVGSGLI